MCVYIISTCELGLEQETDGRQSAVRFATHESEILCKPSRSSSDCSIYSSQTQTFGCGSYLTVLCEMWSFLATSIRVTSWRSVHFVSVTSWRPLYFVISVMSWTSAYFVDTGGSANPAACLSLYRQNLLPVCRSRDKICCLSVALETKSAASVCRSRDKICCLSVALETKSAACLSL
jgi:hypothetical protein